MYDNILNSPYETSAINKLYFQFCMFGSDNLLYVFPKGRTMSTVKTLVARALEFAKKAHEGHKRKYTGEPYVNHPIAVAKIVASVTKDQEMLAAALLHDTIED